MTTAYPLAWPEGWPRRQVEAIQYQDGSGALWARTTHTDTGGDGTAMIRLNAAIARAREELKA